MNSLSYHIGSFCEIKVAVSGVSVCTGIISDAADGWIHLQNLSMFMHVDNFDGILTITNRNGSLQVYRADIKTANSDKIVIDNLQRVVNNDRRNGQRVAVGLSAIVVLHNNFAIAYDAIIQDISISGISISVHKLIDIGEMINVQFRLDSSTAHFCDTDCHVVRMISGSGGSMRRYGCEFVRMSDDDRRLINEFVTKIRSEQLKRLV